MKLVERWNVELPVPQVEPSPRWIRARVGDQVVGDSRRALLLTWFGPGMLPTYCLPPADVRTELLTPSVGQSDAAPGRPGFAIDYDIRVGDTVLERSAILFRDPPGSLRALDGHWSFTWDAGVAWFEEALEVHVHARVPTHRVDAVPSDRHVRIELDGEVLADSRRPHAVFETSLPTRWYFPADDVRRELLVASDTISQCPFKGAARYWSAQLGDVLRRDIAWSYPDPIPECPRIAGLVAFFDEKADVFIDDIRQERPRTPWSP